jgi:hypothetical protein
MEKTKIEQLYENEKARGFVNHLIHSYLPIHKVTKVWNFEKNKPHKCSICGHELIDVETIFERVQKSKEFAGEFVDQMKKDLEGKPTKFEDRFMVKHVTHGAIMAWTGEKTDTMICQPCVQELLNMVERGLLIGDKNITYQVNKMQRGQLFSSFTSSSSLNSDEIKVVEKIEKKIENSPQHKATFGDLEILQNLKKKMEEDEANKRMNTGEDVLFESSKTIKLEHKKS